MVKVCKVKGCPSGRKIKTEINVENGRSCSVSFFQPTTPARLQRWTQSLGIALQATDYICQFHFKKKDIKMYDKIVIGNTVYLHYSLKKILREEALPTVEHQFQLDPEPQHQKQQQQPEKQQQPKVQQQQLRHNSIEYHKQQETPEIKHPMACLKQKLSVLPQYWLYVDKHSKFEFMRLDPTSKQVKNHIILNEDYSITVIYSNNKEMRLTDKITSPDDIFEFLKSVEEWPLCVGTQIEKQRYSEDCKDVIIGDEAYERSVLNPRCKSCRVLRNQLQYRNRTFDSIGEKSVPCKRLKKTVIHRIHNTRHHETIPEFSFANA